MDQIKAAPIDGASVRYHYLDNLRAVALLAGVLLHAGLSFCVVTAELLPSANRETSIIFDYWVWLLHTFRMPLFFLIAGFFAHYLVSRRGVKLFVKNRMLRVALPFVIFWPLMFASFVGLMLYAASYMNVDTPVINMVKFAMEHPDQMQGEEPPISTTHLWFIYYLSIFSLLAALCCSLIKTGERLYDWAAKPWVLLLMLPIFISGVMTQQSIPHPAPESFIPSLKAIAFYGAFYFVGWVFFVRQSLLDVIGKFWPYLAMVSLVFALVFCFLLPSNPVPLEQAMAFVGKAPELTAVHFALSVSAGVLACYLSFVCLWAAFRFGNKNNALLRYLSDGSYWVYIVHLPIVFYLQYYFHDKYLPLMPEFLIISAVTLGLGYLSYALLVRRSPIGWLLNGRKKKR